MKVLVLIGSLCCILSGCSASHSKTNLNWFEDVTDAMNIQFVHDPGPTGDFFIPQSMVAGCGIFDCDQDGRLDLLLLQSTGPKSDKKNQLLRQKADGIFEDISAGSGLDFNGYNVGIAIGDIDNDGLPDVLITQYTGAKLFQNLGHGKFQDITESSGIQNPVWGASAAFFDYDRDGYLDLVIVNYIDYDPSWPCRGPDGTRDYCGPSTFPGTVSRLFHNQGKQSGKSRTFRDVTVEAGLATKVGPGLGVYCVDLSGDDWPDILVTNDGKPNHLWINQRNGTFKDEAFSRGIAMTGMGSNYANMGIAPGDINGDGLIDIFVTHLTTETNTLWMQNPTGVFRDATSKSNVLKTKWRGTGFGTVMADFDADGFLDLALVNGRVDRAPPVDAPSLPEFWRAYAERNQLLRNDGTGAFVDISEENSAFCKHYNVARGLASGDINRDGRPDLFLQATADRNRLFLNRTKSGNTLTIKLIDPKLGGRDMLGAKAIVHCNGKQYLRFVQPSESYLSSSAAEMYFGLGDSKSYDKIVVTWPDGNNETFAGGSCNQFLTLKAGEGNQK